MGDHQNLKSLYNPLTSIYTSPRPPITLPPSPASIFTHLFRNLHYHPNSPALIDPYTNHTTNHTHLKQRIINFAHTLYDIHNISKNDVVLIFSPNSVLFPIAFLSVTGNKVAFGDLKYSNVNTDYNLDTVKLSNFGLPRLSVQKGLTHVSTEDVGNTEYIAPEYNDGEHLTSKSDVWSYRVLLIELITGRHLLDTNRPTNEQNLLNWVQPYIDSKRFEEITDPKIRRTLSLNLVQDLCIIANMCVSKKPDSRPEMRHVLVMVNQLITSEQSGTSLAPNLQSPVSTDVQHTKSSCLPQVCHTKFLKSCFRKKNCCA